jgi:SAM-dependent methyltransferase
MNYYRTFLKFYERAAERMCQDCKDFIEEESKILDLGCGSAIIAKRFQEFFRAEVTGVDVVDRRVFPIPFKIIDGRLLPFPDNHFETTLIFYVLHHSQDPIFLLKEAKRVTRDKILIYEDIPEGFLSKLFCRLHAFSFDNFFGQKTKTSFKTEKGWKGVFGNLNLQLIFEKRISSFFDPVRKKLFVLKKEGT